ncbi:hypothetical protein Acr_27g0000670 [Actinidia rufa]|uniref:Chromo domain-containing protein n=1 Tax=Actinidia rufa TaxID=165716 RepID=A0A7J0H5N5_9ERIC|nr:hypothetical protein Acr_00g0004480 [Actinidia rufa]GFY97490.1 hypothetical protein Acr_12g0000310 [Actinidia rufa]GFZ18328.1 hypothetical protein Acr_27g0000670 [Actinidia rufa]
MDSTMNRERAKTGSASKNGVHSHVLGKEVPTLRLYVRDRRLRSQPAYQSRAAISIKPTGERAVEAILAHREVTVSRHPRHQYLVKWKGLGDEETSWEMAEDLIPFADQIEAFLLSESTRTSTA